MLQFMSTRSVVAVRIASVVAWTVVAMRVSLFDHGMFDHGRFDHGAFDRGMFDHPIMVVPLIAAVAAGSQGSDCHQNSGGAFIASHWLLSLKISRTGTTPQNYRQG
jgi:hypothetical protein